MAEETPNQAPDMVPGDVTNPGDLPGTTPQITSAIDSAIDTTQASADVSPDPYAQTPQQQQARPQTSAPRNKYDVLAQALMGGIMAHGLGSQTKNAYEVDDQGKMQVTRVPLSTSDRIRNIVASALTGLASSGNAPRGSGLLGGVGAGFAGEEKRERDQDQENRQQATEDYERKQAQVVHDANIAHMNALTKSAYFNMKSQGDAMLKPWLDANQSEYDELANTELPQGVKITKMTQAELDQARDADKWFVIKNKIEPISKEPRIANGKVVTDPNGIPQTDLNYYVISGLGTANGNMPITQKLADEVHAYVPDTDSLKAGDSLPVRKWADLARTAEQGEKAEQNAWNDPTKAIVTYDEDAKKWMVTNPIMSQRLQKAGQDLGPATREYRGPITMAMQKELAGLSGENKLPAEIAEQVGPTPTTNVYAGKTYPSIEAAVAAHGKAAEDIKNSEAAAAANARGDAFGRNRRVIAIDTQHGNRPVWTAAGEASDHPERYVVDNAATQKALSQASLLNDIRKSLEQVQKNVGVFDDPSFDKAALAASLANPGSTSAQYLQTIPRGSLTQQQQQLVNDIFTLREQAMSIRSVLGGIGGAEDTRAAILATLPGPNTPSGNFGQMQIDNIYKVLTRMNRGILNVPLRAAVPEGVGKIYQSNDGNTLIYKDPNTGKWMDVDTGEPYKGAPSTR